MEATRHQPKMGLNPDDLIQEGLLSSASVTEVCLWLKEKFEENGIFQGGNFLGFREKYEPIWASSENERLVLHVCLYGLHLETLRGIFWGESPYHHKCAILKNDYFVKSCGGSIEWAHGIAEHEFFTLYTQSIEDKENRLLYRFFLSTAIDADLLKDFFSQCGREIDRIPFDEKWNCIFNLLFSYKRMIELHENFIRSGKRLPYDQLLVFLLKACLNPALIEKYQSCTIVEIINQLFKLSEEKGFKLRLTEISTFWELNRVWGLREELDDFHQELAQVILRLANSIIQSAHASDKRQFLRDCKDADFPDLRTLYYENSVISDIFEMPQTQLRDMFSELDYSSLNVEAAQLMLRDTFASQTRANFFDRFFACLKSDGGKAVLGMIRNASIYNAGGERFLIWMASVADLGELEKLNGVSLKDGTRISDYSQEVVRTKERLNIM